MTGALNFKNIIVESATPAPEPRLTTEGSRLATSALSERTEAPARCVGRERIN
jgi:hypothetical protein